MCFGGLTPLQSINLSHEIEASETFVLVSILIRALQMHLDKVVPLSIFLAPPIPPNEALKTQRAATQQMTPPCLR